MNCVRFRQPFFYPMQIQLVNQDAGFITIDIRGDYDVQNSFENLWITSGEIAGGKTFPNRSHLNPTKHRACSQHHPVPKSLSAFDYSGLSTAGCASTSNNQQA